MDGHLSNYMYQPRLALLNFKMFSDWILTVVHHCNEAEHDGKTVSTLHKIVKDIKYP